MTHEFKTPLSSILLSSNFLAKQSAVAEDEKMKKYTGIIIEQAAKLNDHIEKVLDLAKAESTLFKITKEPVILETVINDEMENIRLKYPGAVIAFSFSSQKKVNADRFHFANLVYNLLDNSIKYSGSEPQINITVTEDEHNIILSVKDEGTGISKKHLENIFDKFYRVPGEKLNEVAGFGLGLFYVKKICDAHKWKISASSELNQGTTITILMPKKYD